MATDRERFLLFRVYRNRDEKSFGELYTMYAERIQRFLVYKLPTVADAEEMRSEVFLKAWDYITNTHVENIGGLLYKIARNACANFYRTRGRRPEEQELSAEMTEMIDDPAAIRAFDKVAIEMSIKSITRLLPRLKDEYREAIVMRYLDEMTIKEIAEIQEKSEANVRTILHRALKVLRQILDQEMGPYDSQPRHHQGTASTSE